MKLLSFIIAYLKRLWCFWRWVGVKFYNDGCLTRASALTYTSLLAIVPLMAVVFAVLSTLPVFDQLTTQIEAFIFGNFIPSRGAVVQQYVSTFAHQASQLSYVGLIFLGVTAILMMISVENTLNDLWKVKYNRQLSGSILLYWSMLTLGPLLLGIAVFLSSYLGSLQWWKGFHDIGTHELLWLLPGVCEFFAFTFLYLVVPHCTVKFHHAALGAIVAMALFEIAKKLFGFYISHFPTYTLLYGALATIPIFLLWTYFCWVIFLIGAVIVNGLRLDQAQRSVRYTPYFVLSYRVLGHLWQAQKQERALSLSALLKLEAHCSVEAMQIVLHKLKVMKYIFETKNNCYVLSCDLHLLTLAELYRSLEWFMPEALNLPQQDAWQKSLSEKMAVFATHNHQVLNTPLIEMFAS